MRFIILSVIALMMTTFNATPVAAQATTTAKAKWQEMHDFHDVMSESFHSAEDKNLAPLKEKSGLLVERAKAWQKSPVPAGYKPKETALVLKRLVKQCKKVDKMVKKGKSDAELFAGINAAHDVFHEIMEKCRE
jgi:hypothetical protein